MIKNLDHKTLEFKLEVDMKNLKILFIPLLVLILLGTASASHVTANSKLVGHDNNYIKSSPSTANQNTLTVYYVDINGNDKNNGKTSKNAFKTIQKAINMGKGNFQVMVAKGVYNENIVINKKVTLIGNSSKNTVINGKNQGSCVWIKSSGNVQIKEFTLTNGKSSLGGGIRNQGTLTLSDSIVTGNKADNGGGIYNENTVIIIGSKISNNHCSYVGGGIQNLNTAHITRTSIFSNTAEIGGGINSMGELQLYQSKIINNSAEIGGGLNNDHCVISIVESFINRNIATEGAGIYNNNGILDIFVTHINSNRASYGGGISNYGLIKLYFTNITKNYANIKGGGIYNYSTIYKDTATSIKNNTKDNVNLNPVIPLPV